MKHLFLIVILVFTFNLQAQKINFSTEALNDIMIAVDDSEINFADILETYKGKTIFIDIGQDGVAIV